jgi:hypothetical protein
LIRPLRQLEAQDSAHLKTPTTSLCRRTVIESIPEKVSKSRFTTISQWLKSIIYNNFRVLKIIGDWRGLKIHNSLLEKNVKFKLTEKA